MKIVYLLLALGLSLISSESVARYVNAVEFECCISEQCCVDCCDCCCCEEDMQCCQSYDRDCYSKNAIRKKQTSKKVCVCK